MEEFEGRGNMKILDPILLNEDVQPRAAAVRIEFDALGNFGTLSRETARFMLTIRGSR